MEWRHHRVARYLLWPIGQGYRTGRAAFGLVLLVGLTFLMVWMWSADGDMVTLTSGPTAGAPPVECPSDQCSDDRGPDCLDRLTYTVDVLIPGLDMGEHERWRMPTTERLISPDNGRVWLLGGLRAAGLGLGFLVFYGVADQALEQRRIS